MIQASNNPVDVLSTLVFFLFFFAIGMILLLRPQLGVRLTAQSMQSYQRINKMSDEQLERIPLIFPRAFVGGSLAEFARNGAQQPEMYPNAVLMVRIGGLIITAFLLSTACLMLVLELRFGVTHVGALPEFHMALAKTAIATSMILPARVSQVHHNSGGRPNVVLLTLCVCTVLPLAIASCNFSANSTANAVSEAQSEATGLIGAYIQSMADRDAAQAYALLSVRAKAGYSLSDVEQLLHGNNYRLFEGYESIEVDKVIVTSRFSTNPAVPRTMAQVTGTVNYQGGVQGTLDANMELEDGQWRLSKVWIVVPPEKLQGSPEAMQPTTCSTSI